MSACGIWDEWVEAIMEKMVLKDWVTLILENNDISLEMGENFENWMKSLRDNWVDCDIKF